MDSYLEIALRRLPRLLRLQLLTSPRPVSVALDSYAALYPLQSSRPPLFALPLSLRFRLGLRLRLRLGLRSRTSVDTWLR